MSRTIHRNNSQQTALETLHAAEDEAMRLLGGHARDPLTRAAVIFDLQVRRVAHRIAGALRRIGTCS